MIRLAPFVWSNGGEIVDNPRRPTRFTLDTPKAREALAEPHRPSHRLRRRAHRRGGRGGERRVPLRQRPARHADVVAPVHHDVPVDHRVRLGRRPAADVRASRPASCTPTRTASPRARRTRTPRGGSSSSPSRPRASGSSPPPDAPCRRTSRCPDRMPSSSPTQPPRNAQVFLDAIPYVRPVPPDLNLAGDRGRHERHPGERALPRRPARRRHP